MKARLQIQNVLDAVPSYPIKCTFTQRGGLIGSGDEATWQLQSASKPFGDTIARVVVVDDHFTIEAISDAAIRINGAKAALPKGRPVILSDKDSLVLGDLDISVEIGAEISDTPTATQKTANVGEMVMGAETKSESLIVEGQVAHQERARQADETAMSDPLLAMNAAQKRSGSDDPMMAFKALDNGNNALVQSDANGSIPRVGAATAPDHSDMHFAAMPRTEIKTDSYGFEDVDDGGQNPIARVDAVTLEVETPVDHIALRPLSRRLGVALGDMTTAQANRTLGDIGASLRTAIEGLNRIYKERPKGEGNFPVATMHMHALEDNPLRFSGDTDTALHALFSKRGPVHLSAPAAVKESMDHLLGHQRATETAVDVALDSVLRSLQPKALVRRFQSYDHDDIPEGGEAYDAWCWRMYKAYFSELKSERQKGLQLLFWEMFEHEYNAQMRRAQFSDFDEDDT